jgi:hypothetical protein
MRTGEVRWVFACKPGEFVVGAVLRVVLMW